MIKGVKWRKETTEKEVTEFIRDKIKINVEIKKANVIAARENRSIVVAEVDN